MKPRWWVDWQDFFDRFGLAVFLGGMAISVLIWIFAPHAPPSGRGATIGPDHCGAGPTSWECD